jgi:transposase
MEKACSFRFYPTPEQESLLRRTLGCVGLVCNKALHERTQAWYEKQERVGCAQTSSVLADWKKQEELDWEQVKAEEQINYLTKASIGYGIEKRVGKRQK